MAKPKKKRNKKYTPKVVTKLPMLSLMTETNILFSPLDQFLYQLETEGTIDTVNGYAVLEAPTVPEFYEMTEATEGLVEFFEMLSKRHSLGIDFTGLNQLVARVKYGTVITQLEVDRAKEVIKHMRRAILKIDTTECKELIRDVKIKQAMEKAIA